MAAIDLCTLEEVKLALELTEVKRDDVIQMFITSASSAIQTYIESRIVPVETGAKRFAWSGGGLDLMPYALQSATQVSLDPDGSPTVLGASDYVFKPFVSTNGGYSSLTFSSLVSPVGSSTWQNFGVTFVEVTGTWGWATVPEDIKHGAIATVMSWLRKDTSGFAMRDLDDSGRELGASPVQVMNIPPAVKRLLDPYRRNPGVI